MGTTVGGVGVFICIEADVCVGLGTVIFILECPGIGAITVA